VDVNARVRLGERLDVQRELEVLELRAVDRTGVEQMRPLAVHDEQSVFHGKRAGRLAGLPAVEGLSVEEQLPAGLLVGGTKHVVGGGEATEREGASGEEEQGFFHGESISG
jgi:hypothetical protein